MRERVAITGIGCISSFGLGHRAFVDALLDGHSGLAPIRAFDTSSCRSHSAVTINGFNPADYIAPLKLRRVDEVGRLALGCARLLVEDAGLELNGAGDKISDKISNDLGDDIGIALGTYTAGMDSIIEYLRGLGAHGPAGAPALLFSNTVSNAPASLCAIELGLRGPNVTFNQREASSLAAIAYAVGLIADGRVSAMMSGGTDRLEETFFKVQERFGPLARRRSADEDEIGRPFDRRRHGFVLGEAGVIVLLEGTSAAARRGARSYGDILGVGMASSRSELNGWPEEAGGIVRAMRLAIEDAGTSPDDIAVVFAAANGAERLDTLEAQAIGEVFGGRDVPVVALKGAIGESGVAGAAALATGLMTVPTGVVPPTFGFEQPDAACVVRVSCQPQRVRGSMFLVNAVASGGTMYSLVARAGGQVP